MKSSLAWECGRLVAGNGQSILLLGRFAFFGIFCILLFRLKPNFRIFNPILLQPLHPFPLLANLHRIAFRQSLRIEKDPHFSLSSFHPCSSWKFLSSPTACRDRSLLILSKATNSRRMSFYAGRISKRVGLKRHRSFPEKIKQRLTSYRDAGMTAAIGFPMNKREGIPSVFEGNADAYGIDIVVNRWTCTIFIFDL